MDKSYKMRRKAEKTSKMGPKNCRNARHPLLEVTPRGARQRPYSIPNSGCQTVFTTSKWALEFLA